MSQDTPPETSDDATPERDSDATRDPDSDATVELEVCVRASAPGPARRRQRELIDRARRLEAEGCVDGVEVRTWNRQVSVIEGSGDAPPAAVRTYERLSEFARRRGLSLSPAFEDRHENGTRRVVLPLVCLAVKRDGELVAVFPCSDEGEHHSVADGFAAVEADDLRGPTA